MNGYSNGAITPEKWPVEHRAAFQTNHFIGHMKDVSISFKIVERLISRIGEKWCGES